MASIPTAQGHRQVRVKAPLLLVHYMPWFEAKPFDGAWGWHWTMNRFKPDEEVAGRRQIASHYYPLIGPYASDDPAVLEYHTLLMKVAGIDGVVVDWYGRTSYFDYGIIHLNTEKLAPFLRKTGLKFAVCYEDQSVAQMIKGNALPVPDPTAYARDLFRWLGASWFRDPDYARVDGRPLFVVFGPQYFKDEAWSALFEGISPRPLYLSLHNRRGPADGAFDWPLPAPDRGLKAVDEFYAKSKDWPIAMPVVFPRFHDIYREAGVHELYGSIEDNGGKTFTTLLKRAMESKAPVVQIATWNDWGEGTNVEPSVEFGYRDLEAIQAARRKALGTAFSYSAADLRIPLEIYQLRKRAKIDSGATSELGLAAAALIRGDVTAARAVVRRLGAKPQ
ncbi:MAG TPA: glycoside hydrolase family 71/99-like protein [Chthonomonadaceae bacterium]|nr:glycoside hydrolase family 71/99-like protein [Chthonomonadaceae bacterium]